MQCRCKMIFFFNIKKMEEFKQNLTLYSPFEFISLVFTTSIG